MHHHLATLAIALAALAAPLAHAQDNDAVAEQLRAATQAHDQGHWASARRTFERLARDGVPAAQYNLGVMHLRGELPNASPREALRWMTLAADNGFVTAMYDLGRLYESSGVVGPQNLPESNRWYLRAAEAGSVDAQSAIGTAYYLGRGVTKDMAQAAHWYREAAKGGDVGTQYLIASMYESGDGVAQDLRLARYWYDVAAKNGDVASPSKVKQLDAQLQAVQQQADAPAAAASATARP